MKPPALSARPRGDLESGATLCRNVNPLSPESAAAIRAVMRAARLELFYMTHPFGRDLEACAETNS